LFHVERETGRRVEVSEGSLDESELAAVRDALNGKELVALSQQRISIPLVMTERDEVRISILRSPLTQNLTFLDRESRRPFDDFITPLLRWMDVLQKHSHTTLDEYSGRNNCLPPRKTELSMRRPEKSVAEATDPASNMSSVHPVSPATTVTPQQNSFLMRWQFNHIAGGAVEDTCVVVYPSGQYRMEKSTQGYHDKLKVRAFEDSLTEPDLKQMQELLDRPDLKASTHQNSASEKMFREWELTTLAIARDGRIQQLRFASYFGVPAWISNVSASTDPEERVVTPLRKWLKAHIETRRVGEVKDATATHCIPHRQGE
jgi:hypothetical protein